MICEAIFVLLFPNGMWHWSAKNIIQYADQDELCFYSNRSKTDGKPFKITFDENANPTFTAVNCSGVKP